MHNDADDDDGELMQNGFSSHLVTINSLLLLPAACLSRNTRSYLHHVEEYYPKKKAAQYMRFDRQRRRRDDSIFLEPQSQTFIGDAAAVALCCPLLFLYTQL